MVNVRWSSEIGREEKVWSMFGKNEVVSPFPKANGSLLVNSVWKTIQGEGPDAGTPAIFVRLAKCSLRCHFCFVPSTPILMADNTKKRIDQIKVGDEVMSWAGDHFEPRKVTKVHKSVTKELVMVNISNRITWCTPEHPYLTSNRGWVPAGELLPGDTVVHWDVHTRMRMFNPRAFGPWRATKKLRQAAKARMVERWKNPAFRAAQVKRLRENNPMKRPEVAAKGYRTRQANRGKMTALEIKFLEICDGLPIYYSGNGRSFSIAHKFPDFKVRGQKKVIEIWAADSLWAQSANRDLGWQRKRSALFKKYGHQTLMLPLTYDHIRVKNQPELRERVARFINNGAVVKSVTKVKSKRAWARLYGSAQNTKWVYNLEVEGTHTYIANSLVVHNCDTDFDEGEWDEVMPLLGKILILASNHIKLVVITGGEPLLQNIVPFVVACNAAGLRVSVETAGINMCAGIEYFFGPGRQNLIVCSPKTPKLNVELLPLIGAFKYIVGFGNYAHDDGLPILSTQIAGKLDRVYRPAPNSGIPIFVQPMDEQDATKNQENAKLAASIAMQHGYRLSLQTHKIVGLP